MILCTASSSVSQARLRLISPSNTGNVPYNRGCGRPVTLLIHTEFNTRKFLVWEYDADTRAMADYVAGHRLQSQELVRIGGSWQLLQSLWFYAVVRNWT